MKAANNKSNGVWGVRGTADKDRIKGAGGAIEAVNNRSNSIGETREAANNGSNIIVGAREAVNSTSNRAGEKRGW